MKLEAYISCLRMFAEEYNTNNDKEIQHRELGKVYGMKTAMSIEQYTVETVWSHVDRRIKGFKINGQFYTCEK